MVRRAVLILLVLVGLVAAIVLGLWGTRWTVPEEVSSGAGYMLAATWDGSDIPSGALERPIGIAVAPSGDVYVTDARLRVVRFGAAGEFLGQWGSEGDGASEFRNPVGVAVGRDEAVHVSDYEQDRVQTFTTTGEFLRAFGRAGSGPGEFNAPAGLTSDSAGSLYVADFYNHRVQKWRDDGSFDRVIGHAGRLGAGALHYPTGVTVTPHEQLLVADAYNYQLQWFTADGQSRRRVGYHLFWLWPRPVSSRAGFFAPTDAAVGPDGTIHVADSGNHRVVMLSANGEYLTEWRIPNPDPNIFSPEQVAASPDGVTVYATDLANNRVLVLREEE
jgi:tripartite motif-containing protein 71